MRESEALALRWRDVDLKAGTLTVTAQLGLDGTRQPLKTASMATISIPPALVAEFKAHRKRGAERGFGRVRPDALLFVTKTGRAQSQRNLLRAVHAAGTAAGLNPDGVERVGVHDLRHSLAAISFEVGLTLPQASAQLAMRTRT